MTHTLASPLASARELATLVAAGELSAAEVLDAHLARLDAVNPRLNAVVARRDDAARREAAACDARRRAGAPPRPLDGVPITVKDCLDVAGLPTTAGLPSRAGHVAPRDDRWVARLRAAGAIVVGKTNLAQLSLFYEADNPLHGRTSNPWNPDRSPGGSSGGEGAIVAAGGSALGLGADIGGSVRVPAAFCGIAALKPTAGRFADDCRLSLHVGQRAIGSQCGVLARTVDDVRLGTEVLATGGSPDLWAPPIPLGDADTVDVTRLRVGVYTDDGTLAPSPGVARAVRLAARWLADAGARVVEWTPPDAGHALELYMRILGGDRCASLARLMANDPVDRRAKGLLRAASLPSRGVALLRAVLPRVGQPGLAAQLRGFGHRGDALGHWDSVAALFDYRERFARAMDDTAVGPLDVVLCPPCPLPAYTHGAAEQLLLGGAYGLLWNAVGLPAGVVPVTRVTERDAVPRSASRDVVQQAARRVEEGSAGLPLGVQVAARAWREDVALAVMRAIEEAAVATGEHPGAPPLV